VHALLASATACAASGEHTAQGAAEGGQGVGQGCSDMCADPCFCGLGSTGLELAGGVERKAVDLHVQRMTKKMA
jgi:hypothetical protein